MATTKVEYYNGATLIGTKTSAPFNTFDWVTTGVTGAVTLTAKWYVDDVLVDTTPVINGTGSAAVSALYVDWKSEANCTDQGSGTLQFNPSEAGSWTAGAESTQAINGNTDFTYKLNDTAPFASAVGLMKQSLTPGVTNGRDNLRIGITVNQVVDNTIYIRENGTTINTASTYVAGDILGFRVTGTTVAVIRNGSVIYTSGLTVNTPIGIAAFDINKGSYAAGSQVINAQYSAGTALIANPY